MLSGTACRERCRPSGGAACTNVTRGVTFCDGAPSRSPYVWEAGAGERVCRGAIGGPLGEARRRVRGGAQGGARGGPLRAWRFFMARARPASGPPVVGGWPSGKRLHGLSAGLLHVRKRALHFGTQGLVAPCGVLPDAPAVCPPGDREELAGQRWSALCVASTRERWTWHA
jgi:hypothetical protein